METWDMKGVHSRNFGRELHEMKGEQPSLRATCSNHFQTFKLLLRLAWFPS